MKRYVLIKEVKMDNEYPWIDPTGVKTEAHVFDSFEDAKAAMRTMVTKTVAENDFFPFNSSVGFVPYHEYYKEDMEYYDSFVRKYINIVGRMIKKMIKDPKYFYEDTDNFFFNETDGHRGATLLEGVFNFENDINYLNTNIINMSDENKNYRFCYSEWDDYAMKSTKIINIRLYVAE